MIIDRIKRHNIINGFLFSCAEFSLITILIGTLAVYTILRGRLLLSVIGFGIALNALPVVWFSLNSYWHKEELGLKSWFNAKGRKLIGKRYPESSVDTSIIVVATAIPFLALLLTLVDRALT